MHGKLITLHDKTFLLLLLLCLISLYKTETETDPRDSWVQYMSDTNGRSTYFDEHRESIPSIHSVLRWAVPTVMCSDYC